MNLPALVATYQLRQLEYLLRITQAMTSRLELQSLLRLILRSAAEMVDCPAGLIALRTDEFETDPGQVHVDEVQFQIRSSHGIPAEMLPAFEPLLDVMSMTYTGNATPPADSEDADFDEQNNLEVATRIDLQQRLKRVEEKIGMPLGQVVGMGLLFENELLGIIYLFRSEHAFTPLDGQFLQGFANQAAIAVRNARLYQQLETERSRLATVVENSADGIMILDANRRVVMINQALAAMLATDPQQAIGYSCADVMLLDNIIGDDLCDQNILDDEFPKDGLRCEGDLGRPGGSHISVAVTYTPLFDGHQNLVNVIVNVHDITRFREEEEMKSTFTSIISHELKTPVALIKGYAQTLARPDATWDAETARQSLGIIEEEADRLEALINNLLDVSRIQASGLRLDGSYVDVQKLTAKVAEAYRIQTNEHTIEVDFPKPLPPVWGDEERLRQVFTNLVSNAIKYSPNGGAIRIGGWLEQTESQEPPLEGSETNNERVVLYIADQGIGIPQAELPHTFEQFYRVDSGLRRSTAGAGLGLFLCKAIVDAHGGQIWARSEANVGTTFFFALPISSEAANTFSV